MLLKDSFDRPVSNIRISLTPRCNLKCIYCHREGEVKPEAELSLEEIREILRVSAKFGSGASSSLVANRSCGRTLSTLSGPYPRTWSRR